MPCKKTGKPPAMSNNSHIMAVTVADFVFDADNWIESPGLTWCGDSFETGYVFREQIDIVLAPRMTSELRAILHGEARAVTHPTLDQLVANEDGARVTALGAGEYAQFRTAVSSALVEADWSPHDTYEWDMFMADNATGDYYVIIEFE